MSRKLTNPIPRLRGRFDGMVGSAAWAAAARAIGAVRYQPWQLGLVLDRANRRLPANAVSSDEDAAVALPARRSSASRRPGYWIGRIAHGVSWVSRALATGADRVGSRLLEAAPETQDWTAILSPHPADVAVLAVDMRGFSQLTQTLDDDRHLTDLIGEYLTWLTRVVEKDRGIIFEYTGDGLLALFLPDLVGRPAADMLDRVALETTRDLHGTFSELRDRWERRWSAEGRPIAPIGLGAGISFGRATIGLIGPDGRKHFGVVGEPVNLAAYLCSQAHPGATLVDCESFRRTGASPPETTKTTRLRSKKRHQRIETCVFRYT